MNKVTRLIFKKTEQNTLISKEFIGIGSIYQIEICPLIGELRLIKDNEVNLKSIHKNTLMAKNFAKKLLEEHGVVFHDEVRNRKKA